MNITGKYYTWITNLLSAIVVIYTIYISINTVGTYVTNLLALSISVKREYRSVVSIQLSGIVVIYLL